MADFDFVMYDMFNQLIFEEKFGLLDSTRHADDLLDMEFNDGEDFMFDGEL